MLKKILATALAAAMIFGLTSVAFAASLSDVAGNARESAINQLVGLGVLKGYPDGTFKPGNPITRAEIAKIVVLVVGLGDTADAMAGVPSAFSDVPVDHWASGYIAVAQSQGIVKGDPAGTFRPDDNVSYAEAITMVMRALGYEPMLSTGVWPTAYLTKATSVGVTKGISFSSSAKATRGDVAGFVSNALTKPRLVQTGLSGGLPVYETDPADTLLVAMGCDYEQGWLISSPEIFAAADSATIKLSNTAGGIVASHTLDLAEDATFAGLLGHEVKAWLNTDDEVFFIEDKTAASEVVTASKGDTVYTVDTASKDELNLKTAGIDDNEIEMFFNYTAPPVELGSKNGYTAPSSASTYAHFLDDDYTDQLMSGDTITLIYDGDEVAYAVVLRWARGVVDSVNTAYDRINWADPLGGSVSFKDFDNVTWSGDATKLSAVEEDDVVQFMSDGTNSAIIKVTRNAVTGKLTKYNETSLTVGGKSYSAARYGTAWGATDYTTVVPDLLGETVTLYLGMDGRYQKVEGATADTTKLIGVVLAKSTNAVDGNRVKLFNAAGETETFVVADDVDYLSGAYAWATMTAGDVVTYELNDDGEISSLDCTIAAAEIDFVAGAGKTAGALYANIGYDDDYDQVAGHKLASDAVVFDFTTAASDFSDIATEVAIATPDDVRANTTFDGAYYYDTDDAKVTLVILTNGQLSTTNDVWGLLLDSYKTSDDGWCIDVLGNDGTTTTYVMGTTKPGSYDDAVVYFTKSGSKVSGAFEGSWLTDWDNADGDDDPTTGTEYLPWVVSPAAGQEFRVSKINKVDNLIQISQYVTADGSYVGGTATWYQVTEDSLLVDYTGDDALAITISGFAVGDLVNIYSDAVGVLNAIVIQAE